MLLNLQIILVNAIIVSYKIQKNYAFLIVFYKINTQNIP